MNNRKIKIRYHHLMCIPRYEGKGYSEEFCRNLEKIKDSLKNNNYVLVDNCDDVCICCPKNINGKCTDENKVKKYDKLVKEKLIKGEKIEPKHICYDCYWFYICKKMKYNTFEPFCRFRPNGSSSLINTITYI